MNEEMKKIAFFEKKINLFTAIIGLFISIVGTYFITISDIEAKIEKHVSSDAVINIIRTKVHPMLIFDQDVRYKVDMGGLEYIDTIDAKKTGDFVKTITVKLKNPGNAPLLTCLDSTVDYIITTDQGKETIWIYHLEYRGYSEPRLPYSFFKLEIINGDASIQYSKEKTPRENILMGTLKAYGNKGENSYIQLHPDVKPNADYGGNGVIYLDKKEERIFFNINKKWFKVATFDDIGKK